MEALTWRENASGPGHSITNRYATDPRGTSVPPRGSGTSWNGPGMDHLRFAAKKTPVQTRMAIAFSRR